MRTKVTLVLLFLNVVLFYYIFHYEEKWRDEQKLMEARRRVLGPEAAAIDSLTLAARSAPTIRIERRADGWWLTQPVEWPANPNAITRLVNELQFLEHFASFAVTDLAKSGQTLADYGLAEPAYTVAFTASGKTYELKVGGTTKVENRLYLLAPDAARIHVVGRSLADTLGLPFDDLRAASIFTVPVFEVRSLGLQTAAPANLKVRLRREAAHWSFETPILARANKAAVEVAINGLNGLQAGRFLEARDADLDRTGLSNPALRVTLEGNARRETLLLGAPVAAPAPGATPAEADYYAKIEDKPAVFTTKIPARLLDTLREAQEKLRDTHVLDFEAAAVTAVTLAAPGQPAISLQRLEAAGAAPAWQIVARSSAGQAPQTIPADAAVVAALLQRLTALSAQKFLTDAPSAADLENFGFNRPERELTFNLSTGGGPRLTDPSTAVLQIGITPGRRDAAYARLANAPFVYQIDPEILDALSLEPRDYRQRIISELPEGARLTGLKLTALPAGRVVLDLADATALTAETLAANPAIDEKIRPAAATLLAQLRTLRARRFTAESFDAERTVFDGRAYPWMYRLDFTVALAGGTAAPAVSTLWITERLGGTVQLAGTADFGGLTFELTQEMVDALFACTYAADHDPGAAAAAAETAPARPAAESAAPKP